MADRRRPALPLSRVFALAPEIAALAGGLLISYGAHEIYRPAGFIIAGVLLLAGAVTYVLGAR